MQSSKHFIRMLMELSKYFESLKKVQSETKDKLIEIKNNLEGNNNRVNEAENQNNNLEHKEAKNTTKNPKKMIIV